MGHQVKLDHCLLALFIIKKNTNNYCHVFVIFLVIYILTNYFEQFVISVVVFKHVHWAKLSQCVILQTVACQRVLFLTRLQLWSTSFPNCHDQASFQQKVIDWQLLKPSWEHLFSQDTNLSYLSFLLHN